MATIFDATPEQPILQLSRETQEKFATVLGNIDFSAVCSFASNVRMCGHHCTNKTGSQATHSSETLVPCKILPTPMNGTYNIVFELEFSDGVRWMFKVPIDGTVDDFKALNRKALTSEARTMQMLKTKTEIPVPAVYAFDASPRNDLGVPFIMMEKMAGKPLWLGWDSKHMARADLERFRARVLQGVAAAMVQLNQFTYDQAGSLMFDYDGNVVGIGESKFNDGICLWNGDEEPQQNPEKHIWTTKGPFTEPKSSYLFTLDRLVGGVPIAAAATDKGMVKTLRTFINWACQNSGIHGRKFVLSHPDLDFQNILVAEDGTVTGFIDWDGAAAVPREIGCSLYPQWLMRDWVMVTRNYGDVDLDEIENYRAMYAHFMEVEIERIVGGSGELTELGTLPREEANITRRSALLKNLEMAANWPSHTIEIMEVVLGLIEQATTREWDVVLAPIANNGSSISDAKQHDSSAAENKDTDDGTVNDLNPLAKDDLRKMEHLERLLSDASAKVSETLSTLNASPGRSQKPIASRAQGGSDSDSEQRSAISYTNAGLHETGITSRKVRTYHFCCGLGERVLRHTAEALYRKNKQDEEATRIELSMKSKFCHAIKTCLSWLQYKIQYIIDINHQHKVEPDKASSESVDVNLEKTKVAPVKDQNLSMTEEIKHISEERLALLREANLQEMPAEPILDAAPEEEPDEIWIEISRDVEEQGVPVSSLRKHRDTIVASIVEAVRIKESQQTDPYLQGIPSGSTKVPLTVDEVEAQLPKVFKVPEEHRDESNTDHSGDHLFNSEKSESETPASTVSSAAQKGELNLAVGTQKLKSLLGIDVEAPKVSVAPKVELEKHELAIAGLKLKALLGIDVNKSRSLTLDIMPKPFNPDAATSGVENTRAKSFETSGQPTNEVVATYSKQMPTEPAVANVLPENVTKISATNRVSPANTGLQSHITQQNTTGQTESEQKYRDKISELRSYVGMIRRAQTNLPKDHKPEAMNADTTTSQVGETIEALSICDSNGNLIPRNKPCPCGSRHKFKKCCGKDQKSKATSEQNDVATDHKNQVQSVTVRRKSKAVTRTEKEFSESREQRVKDMLEKSQKGGPSRKYRFNKVTPQEPKADPTVILFPSPAIREMTKEREGENWELFWPVRAVQYPYIDGRDGEKGKEISNSWMQNGYSVRGDEGTSDVDEKNSVEALAGSDHNTEPGNQREADNEKEEEFEAEDDWVDDGEFNILNVCNALGRGELDEWRMLRLKQGFLKLLVCL